METDDIYSQNSVSDIIAAHLMMLMMMSFEKYYPEHEDPRRQNIWIVNPLLNTKRQPFPTNKPFKLLNYHRAKDWKVLLIL